MNKDEGAGKNSKEIQLVFVLCRLAIVQLQERGACIGFKELLNSEVWSHSSIEEKHDLLKWQYETVTKRPFDELISVGVC